MAEAIATICRPVAHYKVLAGGRPAEFAFGAILNSSDDGRTRRRRSYKFASNASYRLANFQASLIADPKRGAEQAGGPALPDSLPLSTRAASPCLRSNCRGSCPR